MSTDSLKSSPRWVPAAAAAIVIVVIPLLTFGLIEFGFRVADYGVSGELFVESGIPGHYLLHNDYYRRFHPRTVPSDIPERSEYNPVLMQHPKPDNVFRIFVLGGSTAEGFPYVDQHAFPAIAGSLINSRLENTRVEVVNLSRSAMSSYYVRETARRSWDWDPDLLLVYAGHNEYYGTIGAGSGSGHLRKLLYMRLKELRSAQWLFNRLNPAGDAADPDDPPMTLMAERMADGLFPQNEHYDTVIAERFIDNLEAVRTQAERKGIPMIVLDPVSNLVSMPPFEGQHSDTLAELIEQGIATVIDGEQDSGAWLSTVEQTDIAKENAHIRFLQGLMQSENEATNLSMFVHAKDSDTIPFRARTVLRRSLADWAADNAPTVKYVALQEKLQDLYGTDGFSDLLFIDHLHFSHRGQLILGRLTADAIAESTQERLNVRSGGWPPAEAFRERLFFHPASDIAAARTIQELIRNPPFRDMIIPYQGLAAELALQQNPLMQENPLAEQLRSASGENAIQIIGDYLYTNQRWEEYILLLNTLIFISPGSYNPHYTAASVMESLGSRQIQVLQAYQRAYLLSGKQNDIQQDMQRFAETAGFEPQLQSFLQQTGEY